MCFLFYGPPPRFARRRYVPGFAKSSLASLTESALRLISLIPAPAGAGLVRRLTPPPFHIARPIDPAWNLGFYVLPQVNLWGKKQQRADLLARPLF
jgi:hypothetical protein